MEWALVDGVRSLAREAGTRGVCPGCGGVVQAVAVESELVAPHWRHESADCDPWSEGETEWHRGWKARFPVEWQEVTMGPHRADVKGPDGVLEIQRSGISIEDIREREQFYGRMTWLLCGHDFWSNLVWLGVRNGEHRFRWKHARKSWFLASRALLIDTPWGLLSVKRIRQGSWNVIEGRFIKPEQLMKFLDREASVPPCASWLESSAQLDGYLGRLTTYAKQLNDLREWFERLRTRRMQDVAELYRQGRLPFGTALWMTAITVEEWLTNALEEWAKEAIEEWEMRRERVKEFLAQEERRQQEALERYYEERDQREWERLEAERRQQLALQEANRISRERYEQEQARQAEERRRAELACRVKERSAVLLQQVEPLVLEWRRSELVEEFLCWRDAPVDGFGRLETAFIESCLSSLQAAGARGSITRRTGAAPQPLSGQSLRSHQPVVCGR